jgi:cytochrome c biogenesis protein CcdA
MLNIIAKITPLALADAVNPCAIAVLTMVLLSIFIDEPKNRKKILRTGFAFILAVFVGYTFYAGVLIQFFKGFAAFFAKNSENMKIFFGVLAMIIGALNIKDYFYYKKGSFATEMPIFMRPKVKKIINEVHNPRGAFLIGFIVTLFLLPCTAGPLVIAAGILSEFPILMLMPYVFYYNLLFVLPMIAIVLLVYFGFNKIDEISGWKERNIKKLHLVAGVLIFAVGLAILNGWI